MNIGEIISSAGKTLFSRYGKTISAFLAYLLIVFLISLGVTLLSLIPLIGFLAIIALYVIIVPIQFGYMKEFILIHKGEEVGAFDFIKLGFDKFGMSWKVIGRLMLKYIGAIIMMIISYIFVAIGIAVTSMSIISGASMSELASIFTLLGSIGIFITCIWTFILSLKYMFVYNELAYNENATTGKEIVEATAKNMEGNKGKLLLIEIVLGILAVAICMMVGIPIIGLAVFLAMILIFLPYVQYFMIAFYENVRNEKMPRAEIIDTMNTEPNYNQDGPIKF